MCRDLANCLGCSCEAKDDKQETKLVPYADRHCTDLIFLAAYFAFWIVIIAIFASAKAQGGDPDLIIKPVDYLGRICGKSTGVTNKGFGAWPHPINYYKFKVCVTSCKTTSDWTLDGYAFGTANEYYTEDVLSYCIPSVNGTAGVKVELSGDFQSTSEDFSRGIGDVFTAWAIILISAFVALIFSFVYIWLLERVAGLMVFIAIVLILIAGMVLASALITKADEYDKTEFNNRAKAARGMGYFVGAATLVFFILVIAMRKRIRIAIAVVKEATRAVADMKGMVVFPVLPFFIGLGFVVWWISVALYIVSVRIETSLNIPTTVTQDCPGGTAAGCGLDPDSDGNYKWLSYSYNEDLKRAFGAHFFSLLWNVQFLIYFTYAVLAGCIADWYFTPRGENGDRVRGSGPNELSHTPVTDSCKRTARYHLGTIAVGSMIIAIIQFIRAMVTYLEHQAKQGEPNRIKKCIFCCIKCCLWCLECCMDKINKNAFIWMAIWGDNFGTACCSSFQLVWRNLARVAAVEAVGGYLMLLGRVLIALVTAGVCAWVMDNQTKYQEELSSVVFPSLVIFILAFFVASLFMTLMETAIDTVFICFLVDEEANGKAGRMFASPELIAIVDKFSGDSAEHAKRSQTMRRTRSQEFGKHEGTEAGADY